MRPLTVLVVMFVCCAVLTTGCARLKFWKRAEAPRVAALGPKVGESAPELEGVDFDGAKLKLSDYHGKVVVVAFWASWCRPCINLIPHERALVERHRGRPFVMLGVNNDEDPDNARRVIAAKQISWRCCQTAGSGDPINQRWGVTFLPSVYVIDADGIVKGVHLSGAALDRTVEDLVADAERRKGASMNAR